MKNQNTKKRKHEENQMVLRGTQKKKIRKLDKKKAENLVGPEYPGEGAMNSILIAGSTDREEENKNFLS